MKKLTVLLGAMLFVSFAFGQKTIKLEEVANHVGDSVMVCGKVMTARFIDRSEAGPTLLNLGKAFPDQLLTVVIYRKDRQNFDIVPETDLLNKEICITGVVVMYKEKPQIVLYSKDQLKEVK
jgi:hypothetical protein